MHEPKTILIRLPNWLGDMVMASSFVKAVQEQYPSANIDLIAKKDIQFLLEHFPPHGKQYIFSKQDYKGLKGAKRFGREIRKEINYDLFFCLPESLSSAAMGKKIKARTSVGFRKGINFLLLNKTYKRKKHAHRVEEYVDLLSQFTGKEMVPPEVSLNTAIIERNDALIININSEASSRRLPKEKAVSIINTVRQLINNKIILVGSPKEKPFVDEVYGSLSNTAGIENIAGQTSLPDVVNIFASAKGMLSTDSGPAHVSNALGTKTVVLFGAGNELNTAPYNKDKRIIIRLGKLSCEPCTNNICKRYGTPECLLQLDENFIAQQVIKILS